jgi:hypothetical protein
LSSSSRRIPLLPVLLGLAIHFGLAAAQAGDGTEDGSAASGQAAPDLDEVAVIGKKLRTLRREVIAAEDRFYRRFNALNTIDDFDIRCEMDKATGTLVPKRQCRIQFLVEAGAKDGQEFYAGLSQGRGINTPAAALQMQWLRRREEYRRTARALLEKDSQLLALAVEWGRLQEEYDRALMARRRKGSGLFE